MIDYHKRAVETVECPACHAPKGNRCFGASGRQTVTTHFSRRASAQQVLKGGVPIEKRVFERTVRPHVVPPCDAEELTLP